MDRVCGTGQVAGLLARRRLDSARFGGAFDCADGRHDAGRLKQGKAGETNRDKGDAGDENDKYRPAALTLSGLLRGPFCFAGRHEPYLLSRKCSSDTVGKGSIRKMVPKIKIKSSFTIWKKRQRLCGKLPVSEVLSFNNCHV
jgi:hypothetical protein